jgi:hypothetical protein
MNQTFINITEGETAYIQLYVNLITDTYSVENGDGVNFCGARYPVITNTYTLEDYTFGSSIF